MRRVAIDWMRGFVMVLMVLDHASVFFNAGRVSSDGAESYVRGSALPLDQFLTRWVTHLCAPTFLFLAGTSLALSTERRIERGQSARDIDRDLLTRGFIILLLDVCYMSLLARHVMLQVLYAIGMSMLLMVPLRRLSPRVLCVGALSWFAVGEAITSLVWRGQGSASVPAALVVATHSDERVWIFYPFVPWLAIMVLGWVFGQHLVARERQREPAPVRLLVAAGVTALVVFTLVRTANGYGNMFLPAESASLAQLLHVSKYPPALSYAALELGLMALALAFFMVLEPRVAVRPNGPLLVFGQTALFFYLVHFTLLGVAGAVAHQRGGLGLTYAIACATLVLLYPLCRAYRRYKQGHPQSWVRFI